VVLSYEVIGKVRGKIVPPTLINGSSLSGDASTIFKGCDVNSKIYIDAKIKGPDGKITNVTQGIKVIK
jgi:hypothetical protein